MKLLYAALLGEEKIAIYERYPDGTLALRENVGCIGGPMWSVTV